MTEAQAHKFVAWCGRIFVPLRARTEREALRDMNASAGILLGGGLLAWLVALVGRTTSDPPFSVLWCAVAGCAVVLVGVALVLLWQFRKARQSFDRAVPPES